MIGFLPKKIILGYSSVPQDEYSNFDKMSGYLAGAFRIYKDIVYRTLQAIDPMCDINYYNEDSLNLWAFDNLSEKEIDYTAVPVVTNTTIVWEQTTGNYYKALVTSNVDLSTSLTDSLIFEDLGTTGYRNTFIYPNGKENTLYWEYNGSTNRNTMFDGVVNAQTINDRQVIQTDISFTASTNTISSLTKFENIFADDKILISGSVSNNGEYTVDTVAPDKLSFTVKETGVLVDETAGATVRISTYTYIKFIATGVDKIAIFNTFCDEIEIVATYGALVNTYNIEMIDKSVVTDFSDFCFLDADQLKKLIQNVDRDYNVQFEITFKGTTQRIGEVVIGDSFDMGKGLDSASLDGQSYNNAIEASNGDVYFPIDEQRVITRTAYEVLIPTNNIEAKFRQNNRLLNQLMVINGSNEDKGDLQYLVSYGFFNKYKMKPKTTGQDSTYSFEFRSIL